MLRFATDKFPVKLGELDLKEFQPRIWNRISICQLGNAPFGKAGHCHEGFSPTGGLRDDFKNDFVFIAHTSNSIARYPICKGAYSSFRLDC